MNEHAIDGSLSKVHRVLRQIEGDVPPHLRRMLFNTAIKACRAAGEYEVATKYFEVMVHRRIQPSARTYGKLMHTALWAKNYSEVERWLQRMVEEGHHLDEQVYAFALRAAANGDNATLVDKYVKIMTEHNFDFAGPLMGAMVEFYLRRGNQSMADYWFDRALMMDDGEI